MTRAAALLFVPLLLSASSPGSAPALQGSSWRLAAIDGQPVQSRSGEDEAHPPGFAFAGRSYGGSAGCNALGGLYAQVGSRLYTMPGPQTQIACGGALARQETAANAVFAASPIITATAAGFALTGGGHALAFTPVAAPAAADPPPPWQGPGVSAQSYVIHAVNGRATEARRVWGKRPPRLSFTGTTVIMALDCSAPARGRYVQDGAMIATSGLAATCRSPGARDAALAAILAAPARAIAGPNGELLLAGPAGWAILWNDSHDRPK